MKIVFVHFGKDIPAYLRNNLKTTYSAHPQIPITLITNVKISSDDFPTIDIFPMDFDSSSIKEFSFLDHPKNFRDFFWFKTIYRFFALQQFMAVVSGELLHIESDVRISSDFPFAKFSKMEFPLAYPLVDNKRGIASTIFFRDMASISHFTSEILKYVRSSSLYTDMTLLGQYQIDNPEKVLVLPSGPFEMMEPNLSSLSSAKALKVKQDFEYFGGYFDGYAFGQFYFGTDPRNTYGISKTRILSSSPYLFRDRIELKWVRRRDFPFLRTNSESIPIFSLHMHSKRPHLFRIKRLQLIYLLQFGKCSFRRKLIFRVFILLTMKKIEKVLKSGFHVSRD